MTLTRRGRALLVLSHMARQPDAITMTEFTRASLLASDIARALREDLVEAGLIETDVSRMRGPVEVLSIRLTPLGRKVAEHARAIEDLLEDEPRRAPER